MYLDTISGILFGTLFVLFINLLLNLLVFDRLKSATREDLQRKLGTCPMVSILVPARNEADHIEECVRPLIGQSYLVALPEKGRYVEGPLLCAVGEQSHSPCTKSIIASRSVRARLASALGVVAT